MSAATTETDCERWAWDFREGYDLGYQTGYDVGYVHGARDEGEAWTSALTGCTSTFRSPRHDELITAREVDHGPCTRKCRSCSKCIHSLSYWSRGGRDFLGVEQEAALAQGGAA